MPGGGEPLSKLSVDEELMALVLISSDLLERSSVRNGSPSKRSEAFSFMHGLAKRNDNLHLFKRSQHDTMWKRSHEGHDHEKRSHDGHDHEKRSEDEYLFKKRSSGAGGDEPLTNLSVEEELMALVLISSDLLERSTLNNSRAHKRSSSPGGGEPLKNLSVDEELMALVLISSDLLEKSNKNQVMNSHNSHDNELI